jgi:hypothetical protein
LVHHKHKQKDINKNKIKGYVEIRKMTGRYKDNPPCEYCGSHKYTDDELIFRFDDDENIKPDYRGLYICPDCVLDSYIEE